jgi:hypothetical protein
MNVSFYSSSLIYFRDVFGAAGWIPSPIVADHSTPMSFIESLVARIQRFFLFDFLSFNLGPIPADYGVLRTVVSLYLVECTE